ncbi:MAG: hypothetical protein GY929_12630, partial [Actinomycetia bacterium]|nr:hypothetical protein [Actinomycetes bacterium]
MFRHRTALVTAGAIVGVLAAGATAVGASLGILDATGDSTVGQLDLAPTSSLETIEVVIDRPQPIGNATGDVQLFAVADAATVGLALNGTDLVVESIDPGSGWSTTNIDMSGTEILIEFTGNARVLVFRASTDGDSIAAVVEEVQIIPTAVSTDDDHDDDDHDDDD